MRTALVSGATRGIGRATALALGDAGWWVLANGRDEIDGKKVAEELEARSSGEFAAADLTDEGVPQGLVDRAVERTGRLDLLVNNAGIHFLSTIDDTDVDDFDRLMAVNLRAAVLLTKAAVPAMREAGGGVVVNVSSEAGLVAVPGQAAYNLSKAALIMLTKCVAVDHASDGIRAVSICPGTTRTPLVEEAIASAADPEAHEKMLQTSRPANRLGTPDEVARAIVFVAGEEVSYMTGSEVVIDGGFTAI